MEPIGSTKARRRRSSSRRAARQLPAAQHPPAAQHLFDAWPEISKRLRANRQWALFLDFDGTLVKLQPRPGLARLPAHGQRLLQRLARNPRVRVVVVSGRTLESVRGQVGVEGIGYMGQHGMELEPARTRIAPEARHALVLARRAVGSSLHGFPGVWVEDKGACFAVHYRGAKPAVVYQAGAAVRRMLDPMPKGLRILAGKKVWEVLPRRAGKGVAMRESLKKLQGRPLVIFAGDDTTDEEAFGVLRGAITIRVGSARGTHAKYFLRSPHEVMLFLERLEALL